MRLRYISGRIMEGIVPAMMFLNGCKDYLILLREEEAIGRCDEGVIGERVGGTVTAHCGR